MDDFPKRIVYVEDENDLRFLMREALESKGYDGSMVTCSTGRELINRVRELQPDLVLLDLRMPDMDGTDVVEEMLRDPENRDVRIIFVTAADKVEMEKHYKLIQVIGIIHKPIDIDKVYDQIQEYWMEYKAETEGAVVNKAD